MFVQILLRPEEELLLLILIKDFESYRFSISRCCTFTRIESMGYDQGHTYFAVMLLFKSTCVAG